MGTRPRTLAILLLGLAPCACAGAEDDGAVGEVESPPSVGAPPSDSLPAEPLPTDTGSSDSLPLEPATVDTLM